MKKSDVKALASMPLQSPTYPRGPYNVLGREYLVINDTTDPALIRAALPEPIKPAGVEIACQWMDIPGVGVVGPYDAKAQASP